jgi:hypothetical protein
MDEPSKKVLQVVGIQVETISDLNGLMIPREQVISYAKYDEAKKLIPELKSVFSSSYMTSLQQTASKEQKWPMLNLIRQILKWYHYDMEPIRKSDGYTPEGVKKYKRFFHIKKRITAEDINNTKKINIDESALNMSNDESYNEEE